MIITVVPPAEDREVTIETHQEGAIDTPQVGEEVAIDASQVEGGPSTVTLAASTDTPHVEEATDTPPEEEPSTVVLATSTPEADLTNIERQDEIQTEDHDIQEVPFKAEESQISTNPMDRNPGPEAESEPDFTGDIV